MDLRLIELGEHMRREALDAKPEDAEARAAHRLQALHRHRVNTVVLMNCSGLRYDSALFGRAMPATAAAPGGPGERKDVILEDDGAHARMGGDDALDHAQAFVGREPRDRGHIAWRDAENLWPNRTCRPSGNS